MSAETLLSLLVVMVALLLIFAGLASAFLALRWWRSRGGRRRPRGHASSGPTVAAHVATHAAAPRPTGGPPAAERETRSVTHGDVPEDDPRILALGLEAADSTDAVFRNLDRIAPLLRAEVEESDRIGRTTPLAGRALRASGVFLWCSPAARGGLEASYADRLEAVTRIARIDAGMAWVSTWISAHGEITGRLDDESYAQLYPRLDLPTAFSATPLAKAVEVPGDGYRIEEGRWRLGSGGYHADRWLGGAKVWDTAGNPVIDEVTGDQKVVGVWLPPDKVRQVDDWDPLGVRSSGSASYYLTEPIEVPRRWSFNVAQDSRPYFFPFMGVMVGAAQHLVDLTFDQLRKRRSGGTAVGGRDMTALADAMASLDMLVFGLRGYAQYIDAVRAERPTGALTREEAARLQHIGMPVRDTVMKVRDLTSDIYGTGYVSSGSEFGRVLRDIQVGLAHWWFRLSATQGEHEWRVGSMIDDASVVPLWDAGWPIEIKTEV